MAAAPMMMAAPAAGGAAASVPDAPVTPLEFLRVLVCRAAAVLRPGVHIIRSLRASHGQVV
jgi:hypothetical protein